MITVSPPIPHYSIARSQHLQESIPITTASFYANISDCELAHIMRSDTASEMPLLSERLCSLHEAGQVLMQVHLESCDAVGRAITNTCETKPDG